MNLDTISSASDSWLSRIRATSIAMAIALLATPALLSAAHHEEAKGGERAAAVVVEAVIVAIDKKTREVSMELPMGNVVTLTAGPDVKRLQDFAVGDSIVATYLTSLAGEVRAPTEEEKAEPWVVLEGEMVAEANMPPGVAGMRVIRAVCTIEGMNRITGTVMVKDPRGKFHVIADVKPERMEGVTLGTNLIITYSEAVALSLEKADAAG